MSDSDDDLQAGFVVGLAKRFTDIANCICCPCIYAAKIIQYVLCAILCLPCAPCCLALGCIFKDEIKAAMDPNHGALPVRRSTVHSTQSDHHQPAAAVHDDPEAANAAAATDHQDIKPNN
jgi:hypothetical protein